MDIKNINELIDISQNIGCRIDYIQGGGGNTSVKSDNKMAIKASGYLLKDIKEKDGYVVMDYKMVMDYVKNYTGDNIESDGKEIMKKAIADIEGLKKLRPSVEAGFHSVLLKYVMHSHSAYANILCCSEEGRAYAQKIFNDRNMDFLWLPYMNPGFELSRFIYEKTNEFEKKNGEFPKIIFMENHGLIITDDDMNDCKKLHEEVNSCIKEYLKLDSFPDINLRNEGKDTYISNTVYILEYLMTNNIKNNFFSKNILYPDQIVYINNNLESKICIDSSKKELIYKTIEKEAVGIEETLLAYLYVIDIIAKNNMTLQVMGDEAKAFIKNWDAEKYRKELMAKK
jgi:ribulose-5-phosphate 4-epimerase/fuculose-1-phosphate aldolase